LSPVSISRPEDNQFTTPSRADRFATGLLAGEPVDAFADEIGVAVVSRVLTDHVCRRNTAPDRSLES
jgi:hypothetical protein